ncbi:MAG: alkyldihydroxyacetonephosphate synthase [Thermoleophilaceae bacterium]|nr:alkyldihydroxyacetonephosphate synthase [Thermoleophilaceae bacterium]
MTLPDPQMRWWGWGEPEAPVHVSEAGWALLRDEMELQDAPEAPPPRLEDVRLADPALPGAVADGLRAAVGEQHVVDDTLARVRHAAGRSYPDLVRLRAGGDLAAPDAVVLPGSADEVAAVLAVCDSAGVAVVPFGGGTSVVGGVEPLGGGFDAVIALDLRRLDSLEVDRRSLTATIGGGLPGRRAEARLQGRGLTLGHFPQSFEFASVGGYVATRSAGQASTGYGRIDELVLGARMIAPAGEILVKPVPASAAGPALRELVVGSEGVLGAIVDATLAVAPLPEFRRYEGWSFRSFGEGAEAFRALEQGKAAPDVARLSDEEETRLAMALSSSGGLTERAGRAYLRARGHDGGCIVIVGWEGDQATVARRRAAGASILSAGGGLPLGQRPGRAWLRTRYVGPYLRDVLLGRGVLAETLETATTWTQLDGLHRAVGAALSDAFSSRGTPPLVGCHVSHLYRSGASLYFTYMARAERGAELDQWRAAKDAACDAIVANGGTLTHHHAVGVDHAPWMGAEVGDLGLELLRAAKERLDPRGIMNPGKLIPLPTS